MSFELFPVVATIRIGRLVPAMARPIQISVLLGKKELFDIDYLFILSPWVSLWLLKVKLHQAKLSQVLVFGGKAKSLFSQRGMELVSSTYNGVESGTEGAAGPYWSKYMES